MAQKEENWITINGTHVLLEEGETKEDAIKKLESKNKDKGASKKTDKEKVTRQEPRKIKQANDPHKLAEKIGNEDVEDEEAKRPMNYTFPQLSDEQLAKAKEMGLVHKGTFSKETDWNSKGDMILVGSQKQLEEFADTIDYSLNYDYLMRDSNFDYEDLPLEQPKQTFKNFGKDKGAKEPRKKVVGIKERTENSANIMKDYLNDFYLDDEDVNKTPQEKSNMLLDEFQNNYYDGRSNYQEAFGQFLLDYGVSPMYYDDIYDEVVKIGYLDDPKYKEDTDKLMQVFSFNMVKGIEKLAGRKIYEKR